MLCLVVCCLVASVLSAPQGGPVSDLLYFICLHWHKFSQIPPLHYKTHINFSATFLKKKKKMTTFFCECIWIIVLFSNNCIHKLFWKRSVAKAYALGGFFYLRKYTNVMTITLRGNRSSHMNF